MKRENPTTPPFIPNYKLTLLTAVVLPMLISLGVWQLDRAAQKRELEAAYIAQQAQPPVQLHRDTLSELPDYRRVVAVGKFDRDHTWLLDNKQREGRVGYEIIVPFYLRDGGVVLVNRGWIQGAELRANLPRIPYPPDEQTFFSEQTLFGEIVTPSHHPLLNAEAAAPTWPRVVMAIEPGAMGEQLGQALPSRYLRLDEASPGALITQWQAVNLSAAKHSGYALQWFAMAIALVIWFVVVNTKVMHTWRQRKSHKNHE